MVVTWIALILSIFMMEKIHGQIRMGGGGKKMLKRYKMYYNEAVGKIEMIGEPDYDVGDFRIG